jgi:DNA-binding CsgD family transcriptional regulator/tetratricopeptide (TPR) repeat protein
VAGMVLLERNELLDELAAAGPGRLVFVGGEAGVGKTSLVRAFSERAEARVLQGACEPLTTPAPLGPFVDVAAQTGGAFATRVATGASARDVALALAEELDRPAVLVLEDVHWADEASLDVLRVLGRRVDRTRALVLATYRDELDADHPLRVVLGQLASMPAVSRCAVPPLSLEAVRTLAEPSGADAEAIYSATRGNPFYVTEILAAGGELLPATARDAVLARAARLEPAARRLLEVVAAVPARTELWLLEAVAGADLDALGASLAAGMLREDGDAVGFRHELARLAIESAVAPHRRRAVHASILAALASPPAGEPDDARLAHHAEQAGDDQAAFVHSKAAGERAVLMGAHREAAAQFSRALRHAPELAPADRAAMLARLAQEAHVTGRYAESIDARDEAISLYRELGDRLAEGENLARGTMPFIASGRNAEAEQAGRAAIDLLETLPPSRELAVAYAFQSYLRMLDRDNAEGADWGEKALELAERFDDVDTAAMALNMTGTSHLMAGEIELGCDYLNRSLDVARRHGLEHRIASAFTMLGSGLGEMYELERAERWLREQVAFANEHDLDSAYTRSWLAAAAVYRGRWDEGAALARDLVAREGNLIARITAQIALGRVRARRGDPGAFDVLDEALEHSLRGGHLQRLGHVRAARAEAAWLSGDRDRTMEEARAAYPLALEKRHLWFAGELAYWLWKAGAEPDAPDWIAEPYRLQLDGDPIAAVAAWRARDCPYEAARALGEAEDDGALLEALAALEQLGARPAAAIVSRRLRERGVRGVPRGPRPATRANPAGLTRRELEVLALLQEGLRNAEIAARLVIAEKTVDHHVSAILGKLGVRSRAEAVKAAAGLEDGKAGSAR